jgi:hypothetical protein
MKPCTGPTSRPHRDRTKMVNNSLAILPGLFNDVTRLIPILLLALQQKNLRLSDIAA